MSHGRIINLDTPDEIKKNFGVGYNIYIEAKHQFEDQLDEEALAALFNRVCLVFLDKPDLPGVKKSRDSNDKKLIITVPSNLVQKLGDLIAQVEENVPEVMIDLELNSLEDAFIKIAEGDIRAEEQKMQALANKELFLSAEDEEKAMQDYFSFEGRQSCCKKVTYVLIHRLHLFKRDGLQWFASIIPIIFVAMMAF